MSARSAPSPAPIPPLVPGSRSLRAILPESYRQGDFADRFIAGFDDTLAPVITTLDCLDAYFGARTAPEHFLTWTLGWSDTVLPAWIGATGRRNALLLGRRLHGLRGTRQGLELLVREVLGGRMEISESGGTQCSTWPEQPSVTDGEAWARIHVLLPHGTARRAGVIEDAEDLVREWVPAHVSATVTVADDADPLTAVAPGGAR
ncbi:hypothetical protein [Streptomyces sp. NPDC058579]|uniref:hypothetical protein n=1 Tax=Streptomyces sp. NPDC058579 TaxID=3346548 RepID=UPI0036506B9E